jgi:hypothetical protein
LANSAKKARRLEPDSGREIISQADQDVTTFQQVISGNPEVAHDLNAPFWRPIGVVAGNGFIPTLGDPYSDKRKFGIDQSAVSIRRLPYTKHRLDEYVFFAQPEMFSIAGVDKLGKLWNLEKSPTYFRGAERLGRAYQYLRNANILHYQSFVIPRYYNYGRAAWMNFNNIAIDGSIGDFDSGSKIDPKSGDVWHQRYEAFGSSLMYLMFVHRMNPDLLGDKKFIYSYFKQWQKGLGKTYHEEMTHKYDVHRGTFEDVVESIETLTRWYDSPVDTGPNGSRNTIGYQEYLHDKSKNIWTHSAHAVVNTVKANRELVGI